MVDLVKIEQLLNIAEMTREYPALKSLHDYIIRELNKVAIEFEQKETSDAQRYPTGIRPGSPQTPGSTSPIGRRY